jgi:hypothetical protein
VLKKKLHPLCHCFIVSFLWLNVFVAKLLNIESCLSDVIRAFSIKGKAQPSIRHGKRFSKVTLLCLKLMNFRPAAPAAAAEHQLLMSTLRAGKSVVKTDTLTTTHCPRLERSQPETALGNCAQTMRHCEFDIKCGKGNKVCYSVSPFLYKLNPNCVHVPMSSFEFSMCHQRQKACD